MIGIGFMQLISGVILIKGVSQIRHHYNSRAPDSLNTRYMNLHATAFGLFLFADLVYGIPFLTNLFIGSDLTLYLAFSGELVN